MATAQVALPPDERIHRITLDRYHAMIRAGVLTPEDRLELLEGVLVESMPTKPAHRIGVRRAFDRLAPLVPEGFYLDRESPITLAGSEPEPDLCVVRGRTEDYADRHPGVGDIVLVVEVSDTTIQRDRGWKKAIYAAAGIPLYWIVDLNSRVIERYAEPQAEDYTVFESYGEGGAIPAFDGAIAVSAILPPLS